MSEMVRVIPLERLRMRDLPQVGGKNASLGEMIGELDAAGIRVPGGFATTADAFREFLQQDSLASRIANELRHVDVGNVRALAAAGSTIRNWISSASLPNELVRDIGRAFRTATDGADTMTEMVAQGQKFMAESINRWIDLTSGPFGMPLAPGGSFGALLDLRHLTEEGFRLAEELLASQKQFALKVVNSFAATKAA